MITIRVNEFQTFINLPPIRIFMFDAEFAGVIFTHSDRLEVERWLAEVAAL